MFNTIINKKTEYVPFEKTVTEVKAPTDDSIKLLNEFKQKALEDTMLLIEVKNTQFSFVGRYGVNASTLEPFGVIKFSFNGKEITKDLKLSQGISPLQTKQQAREFLIEQYRQAIMECFTEDFVKPAIMEYINRFEK